MSERRIALPPERTPWYAWTAAAVALCYAIISAALPPSRSLIYFLASGDSIVHTEFALRVALTGSLDYGFDPYPVGWHSLVGVALAASLGGLTGGSNPTVGVDAIVQALTVTNTMTWLLYAALVMAIIRLGFLTARACGLDRASSGAAGAAAGLLTMWDPILAFAMRPSFQSMIFVAVAVAVAACAVLDRGAGLRALAVVSAAVVLTAHGWQLALPAPAALWIAVAAVLVRRGRLRGVLAWGLATALVSTPPVLAMVTQIGVGHASSGGYAEPLPWPWLWYSVLGVALVALLALFASPKPARPLRPAEEEPGPPALLAAHGRRGGWWPTALASYLTVATAFGMAAVLHLDVLTYYLRKLLWIALVLSLPLTALLAGVAVAVLGTVGPAAQRRRVTLAAALVVAVLPLVHVVPPTLRHPLGEGETADVPILLRVLRAPESPDAVLVHRVSPYRDVWARQLLALQHPLDPRVDPPRDALDVATECAILQSTPRPTVITTDPGSAGRRYTACAMPVRVVDVSRIPLSSTP